MSGIVAIVRVSQHKDGAVSPEEQRQRLTLEARRLGKPIVAVFEELDVSGGTPLHRRKGMRAAVEMIEAGDADVLAAAYFDRLFRSITVQAEVIERVEKAGGQVLAIDAGVISNGEPAKWITGTMLGVVSEYYRRTVKQRAGEAQRIAVAAGKVPWAKLPPGIVRNPDGTCRPTDDPELRATVVEAFAMRAGTATISQVRAHLADHGIVVSYMTACTMLTSRLYVGELVFGELVNPEALEPMIDPEVWRRVQERHRSRGRTTPSDRLLGRLGVLQCGTCRSRLVVGNTAGRHYPRYRCSSVDCTRKVSIGAELVEAFIVDRVRDRVRGVQGQASAEAAALEAVAAADAAQAHLDRVVRILMAGGAMDEPSAAEGVEQARTARNETRDAADRLMRSASALTVSVDDWDDLSVMARRDIIRDAVDVALVAPGRGAVEDRVKVRFLGDPVGE